MDPVLVILAAVTAFIIFRLISVMGTRSGHEQKIDLEDARPARSDAGAGQQAAPAPPKPVSSNARLLREADANFDETEFLDGARKAYEMIVEAFASGDIKSIRPFLGDDVYSAFKGAIADREADGQIMDVKFVGIERAAIIDSGVSDGLMCATVEFMSNQVRVTRNQDGDVVSGDPNRIDLVKDFWTFAKKLSNRDPNWVLIETESAD